MATLHQQLVRLLPQLFTRASAAIMTAPDLLPLVRPLLVHPVAGKNYSDTSIQVELSKLPAKRDSPISKIKGGHGYYLRSPAELIPNQVTPASKITSRNCLPHSRSIPDVEAIWTELEKNEARSPIKVFPDNEDLLLAVNGRGRQLLLLRCKLPENAIGAHSVKDDLNTGDYFRLWRDPEPNFQDNLQRIVLERKPDADPENDFASLVKKVLRELVPVSAIDSIAFNDAVEAALEKFSGDQDKPLGFEQQLGLIAELWLLQHVMMEYLPSHAEAVNAWHGPKAAEKDFYLSRCLFEVKATGRTSRNITISSIGQLDTDDLSPRLFLFHLRLVKDSVNGKTLSGYVDGVREKLRYDAKEVLKNFNRLLLDAPPTDFGRKRYREEHRDKYNVKYRVYGEADEQRGKFYEVDKDFPRIRLRDLKKMRVNVKTYEINLDHCGDPIDEKEEIVPLLKADNGGT